MARSVAQVLTAHFESGKCTLPVMSQTAAKLQELLREKELDISQVEALAEEDPMLAGPIQELANSTYYGGLSKVTNVHDAIMRLGGFQVARLGTVVTHRANYAVRMAKLRPVMRELWAHSVACASGCQWLAEELGRRELATDAFNLGMLHDVGRQVVVRTADDLHRSRPNFKPTFDDVKGLMEELHVELGVRLAERWSLEEPLPTAIARHHDAPRDDDPWLLRVLRVVDRSCHALGIGLREEEIDLVDEPAVQALELGPSTLAKLTERLEAAVELANTG